MIAGVADNFGVAARGTETGAMRICASQTNQDIVRGSSRGESIACASRGTARAHAGDDADGVGRKARAPQERRWARPPTTTNARDHEDDGGADPCATPPFSRARRRRGRASPAGSRVSAVSAREVRTDRARITAGAVVVCVNAYSQQLVPLRVRPVRGQMLATAPVARRVFERPAYANRGYRYWRQRADGGLLVGGWRDTAADEEVGEEEKTTPRIQEELERFLRLHAADAKVTHRWAGTMGFSHDALPYVGRLETGVFVNAGFTGHGMAFATATGELIANLVRGKNPNETDLFAPERP